MTRLYVVTATVTCDRPDCLDAHVAAAERPNGQAALAAATAELRDAGWAFAKGRGSTTRPKHSAPTPTAEPATGKQHTCDVCGRRGPWAPGWKHYGSVRIDEECGCFVKTCSDECRQHSRCQELIADFEARHRYKRGCR